MEEIYFFFAFFGFAAAFFGAAFFGFAAIVVYPPLKGLDPMEMSIGFQHILILC